GGLPKIDPKKSAIGLSPDWARAGSMAGGAASSAAPTKNERDEMQRAIKFPLLAWPATNRPTPHRSPPVTRGLRPWKGIDWSIVVHSRLRKPNKPNRTGHLCIHLTAPVLSRQSTSADQYRRQIKLGRYVKNKRAAASQSIALSTVAARRRR